MVNWMWKSARELSAGYLHSRDAAEEGDFASEVTGRRPLSLVGSGMFRLRSA